MVSNLNFIKTDLIQKFRNINEENIESEKNEGQNCVHFKLKSQTTEIVRNYYEYTIDGENLSKILSEQLWHNKKSNSFNPEFKFNNYWTGYIGSFDKFWDRIKLLSLFRTKYNKETILQDEYVRNYLENIKNEYHNQIITSLLYEFENNDVPIYGCKVCGDKECGTLNIRIESKDEKYVNWTFKEEDMIKTWTFDKLQYETEIKKLLKFILGKKQEAKRPMDNK
jgi:ferredoxin